MKEVDQKIIKTLLGLLFFLPFCLNAQIGEDSLKYLKRSAYLSDNPKINERDVLVDSIVRSFMQSPQNCGLSIGISENGNSTFYNYGEMSRDSKMQTKPTTVYDIGSLTASFTGYLLGLAVTEKKMSLEDDVRKFLPGEYKNLVFNKNPIRVKHLATHSSGLPHLPDDLITQENYDPANPYKNYSREQIFIYLQRLQLTTAPGSVYDYSSLGLSVLGLVLEKVYGNRFDVLLREKITVHLELDNTRVNLSGIHVLDYATGYTDEGVETPHWILDGFTAAGSMNSSPADLLHFLEYQLEEKDAAAKLSRQVILTADKKTTSLAWFVTTTKQGHTLMYQSGGTFGSGAFMGFLKEKNCSVVVIANSGRNVDYVAIALLNYLQQ